MDAGSTVQAQNPGAFVGTGAAGQYIVNQQDAGAAQVGAAFESTANIAVSLLERQACLWRGRALALQAVAVDRDFEMLTKRARDFHGLIEAALAQSGWMQGQRHDQIAGLGRDDASQLLPEPGGEGQAVLIFERLDHPVDRETVAVQGMNTGKVRCLFQAGTATLAVCGLLATKRALPGR
jgi:hypothetical protein